MTDAPKLSLERPYKDDHGEHILSVSDITEEGEYVLESRQSITQKLGDDFRRIFAERGPEFLEKLKVDGLSDVDESLSTNSDTGDVSKDNVKSNGRDQTMTPEELLQMRKDMVPQLHVAYGEMSQARDLLAVLLSTADQAPAISDLPPASLSSTTIYKQAEIPSVQAFNAQLTIGGKDEALRKAANAFKTAADSMERVRIRGEKYWSDALKTRNANWGFVPAPLPAGTPTGKGADKTARDFWITFGLAESPIVFKQKAVAHLAVHESEKSPLVLPRHQPTRMRVSLVTSEGNGKQRVVHDSYQGPDDSNVEDLNALLRFAQNEVVDQEIFSQLIREAGTLPTAGVRLSERLIVIETAQHVEVRFELVTIGELDAEERATCDLIHASLVLLLVRAHKHARNQRLSLSPSNAPTKLRPSLPLILRPIVNMLQYKLFCARVETELRNMEYALSQAGIPTKTRFVAVGETGMQLVDLLTGEGQPRIGGDAMIRINNCRTLHFTFLAPSTLVVSLPQATLTIASVPQLSQLLKDEVERCLLDSICKIGRGLSSSVEGTWFVDRLSSKAIGRWDTTVL
ncbi:subunit 17 of mediator complex-domain-containing protein [Hysterangium stoloniferum]|nr:subunit 17 of mediator complex-domain-containing protein [Hysterangium stoloniferum]